MITKTIVEMIMIVKMIGRRSRKRAVSSNILTTQLITYLIITIRSYCKFIIIIINRARIY